VATPVTKVSGISANNGISPASSSVILAEGKPKQPSRHREIPDPGEGYAPLVPNDPHATKPRHQVIAFTDEQTGERAEDHAVDMDRSQPAERSGRDYRCQIVGKIEQARNRRADRRRDHEPHHAP